MCTHTHTHSVSADCSKVSHIAITGQCRYVTEQYAWFSNESLWLHLVATYTTMWQTGHVTSCRVSSGSNHHSSFQRCDWVMERSVLRMCTSSVGCAVTLTSDLKFPLCELLPLPSSLLHCFVLSHLPPNNISASLSTRFSSLFLRPSSSLLCSLGYLCPSVLLTSLSFHLPG